MKREHKKDEKKNITEDVKRRHLFTIFYLLDVFCAAVANKIKAGIKLHKSVIFDIGFRNPPPNITLNEHQFRGFFGTIPAFCLSIISHRQYATIHTYSSSDPDIAAGNNAKRKCCRFSGHTAIPSIAVCYRYSSLISGINTAIIYRTKTPLGLMKNSSAAVVAQRVCRRHYLRDHKYQVCAVVLCAWALSPQIGVRTCWYDM